MVKQKKVLVWALAVSLICAQTFYGCALFPFVIPAGTVKYNQSFAEADIPELAQQPDVIDLASRVGEALGYEVSLRTGETLVLSNETMDYVEPVTGEYQSTTIVVYKVHTGVQAVLSKNDSEKEILSRVAPSKFKNETVHILVFNGGVYYKSDCQQHVNQLMTEFKNRLLSISNLAKSNNY